MRVFLAGATGVIGRRLCPLLVDEGWQVTGTTRSLRKASMLRTLGVTPVVVDVFDAQALSACMIRAKPTVVIHQLTDLPSTFNSDQMSDAFSRNARLRVIGTGNLLNAAIAAGARRIVAQSIAIVYAPGPTPYDESSPLNTQDEGVVGVSARGAAALEWQVSQAPLEGVVLRYGRLYGPGTGLEYPTGGARVHVDAAADAARRAVVSGLGVFNIVEENSSVSSHRARTELGWSSEYRLEQAREIARS